MSSSYSIVARPATLTGCPSVGSARSHHRRTSPALGARQSLLQLAAGTASPPLPRCLPGNGAQTCRDGRKVALVISTTSLGVTGHLQRRATRAVADLIDTLRHFAEVFCDSRPEQFDRRFRTGQAGTVPIRMPDFILVSPSPRTWQRRGALHRRKRPLQASTVCRRRAGQSTRSW